MVRQSFFYASLRVWFNLKSPDLYNKLIRSLIQINYEVCGTIHCKSSTMHLQLGMLPCLRALEELWFSASIWTLLGWGNQISRSPEPDGDGQTEGSFSGCICLRLLFEHQMRVKDLLFKWGCVGVPRSVLLWAGAVQRMFHGAGMSVAFGLNMWDHSFLPSSEYSCLLRLSFCLNRNHNQGNNTCGI